MISWFETLVERLSAWWRGDLRILVANGDTLPKPIPGNRMIQMVEAGRNWSVGFLCPCGCGDVIELLLLQTVQPHWVLSRDRLDRPSLHPSVWKSTGCKSHFWIRNGQAVWVVSNPSRI